MQDLFLAHTYIIYLRNIISELAKDGDPNIALLQEYIGKILYTLQSFYSSSNWVEMDGDKTYRDFGKKLLMLLVILQPTVAF